MISSSPVRWHENVRDCRHYNEHVCPTCDFDGYYAANYPDCPWRDDDTDDLTPEWAI
jgi:hypothetical protein